MRNHKPLSKRTFHLSSHSSALLILLLTITACFVSIALTTANTAKAAGIVSSLELAKLETTKVQTGEANTENDGSVAAAIDHVQDLADILSSEEEEALREECSFIGEAQEIDIIILTTDYTKDTRKAYLEEFYDSHDDVLSDAVLILVDMDPDNRGVEIQGYGQCEFSISDDRIEAILDEIVPYLSDGDYYNAFSAYIYKVDNYMSMEVGSNYVHTEEDNLNYNENYYEDAQAEEVSFLDLTLFNLLIAAVVGGISVGIMALTTIFSKSKMTTNGNTYINAKNSRVLGHWDRYIRTTTTRTPKPQNNNPHNGGSGFGGGGVSGSGHSHSGGGRSF